MHETATRSTGRFWRVLLSLIVLLALHPLASFLSIVVATATRGHNTSDVGVPMYPQSGIGFVTGGLVYFATLVVALVLWARIGKVGTRMISAAIVYAFFWTTLQLWFLSWVVSAG